jgi:hypothetical protein
VPGPSWYVGDTSGVVLARTDGLAYYLYLGRELERDYRPNEVSAAQVRGRSAKKPGLGFSRYTPDEAGYGV